MVTKMNEKQYEKLKNFYAVPAGLPEIKAIAPDWEIETRKILVWEPVLSKDMRRLSFKEFNLIWREL